MPTIHPSASIDAQAELAQDTRVGPGCVIHGPVRIAPGCTLIGHLYLKGPLTLGRDNTLYPFVCIGFEPQDRKFDGRSAGVTIGCDNVLRESVTIHASTSDTQPTRLGNHNMLMTNAHMGHDVSVGNHCTLVSGSLIGGHAAIEDHAFVGGNGAVHQFCRMGQLSFLGGGSILTSDLPPFAMASGNNQVIGVNLVGLRRSGADRKTIDAIKAAFHTLYQSRHTKPNAIELIEQAIDPAHPGAAMLTQLTRFLHTGKRGICPHATTAQSQRMNR